MAWVTSLSACSQQPEPPSEPDLTAGLSWAYPHAEATVFGAPVGPGPFRMEGSALVASAAEMGDHDNPFDWFPDDHPVPPDAVAHKGEGEATPCAECHYYNGLGEPGSADLAGLPVKYILQQIAAFRSGERVSARPRHPDTAAMIEVARTVTPEAAREAAEYYAALPRRRRTEVIETDTVPRTVPDKYGWLNPAPDGGTEPIAGRIVELSDSMPLMLMGDDRVRLVDYVPPGAIARGRRVVETGGSVGQPCAACHGKDHGGSDVAPPLSGRSAVYLARTIWDIRSGARRGDAVALMRVPATGLTPEEIRDAAAYLASLDP